MFVSKRESPILNKPHKHACKSISSSVEYVKLNTRKRSRHQQAFIRLWCKLSFSTIMGLLVEDIITLSYFLRAVVNLFVYIIIIHFLSSPSDRSGSFFFASCFGWLGSHQNCTRFFGLHVLAWGPRRFLLGIQNSEFHFLNF